MSINYSEFFRNASSLIASADNTLKYINFSINPEAELIYKSYISDREKLINQLKFLQNKQLTNIIQSTTNTDKKQKQINKQQLPNLQRQLQIKTDDIETLQTILQIKQNQHINQIKIYKVRSQKKDAQMAKLNEQLRKINQQLLKKDTKISQQKQQLNKLTAQLRKIKSQTLKNYQQNIGLCKVCYVNKATYVYNQCGHLSLCQLCKDQEKCKGKCVICRSQKGKYIRVFTSSIKN